MDCAEAKSQIEPYVAGEIAADLKGALEDHLAGCAECRLDSELTRASRSDPVGPDPNAAPALFLESIRPDEAPAEPLDITTAGEDAASAPTGATRAADGSWTLESIFGAGGERGTAGGDALAERAAAAAEPLPEPLLPSMLTGPDLRSRAEEPPASDAPAWDFESADAKGTAKPPAGSLFFAEEALSRGTAAKKKSGVPRILLWSTGALLGVGLLALSIWIAMTVRQPLPSAGITERQPIRAGNGPEIPTADGATPALSAPESMPSGTAMESGAPVQPSPLPDAASFAPSTGAETPAETGPTRAPDRTPSTTANVRSITPPSAPNATMTRTTVVAKTQPPAKPAPAKPAATRPAPTKPDPVGAGQPYEDDDIAALRPPSGSEPIRSRSSGAGTATSGAAATIRSTASNGDSGTAPTAAGPPAATAPAGSGDTVERPIDRLHLATLNAEQNADLLALRKLRDAWRGFVKSSLGPDRARAKRELADCLWAIQTLTAKRSDQKEALVAFRDYVLNAPAGGADTRTVARMRQLEDAVSESR